MMVSGINNVLEALKSAVSKVESVMMTKGRHNPRLQKIITLCQKKSVPLLFREVKTLDRLTGDARHQHVAARISALCFSRVSAPVGESVRSPLRFQRPFGTSLAWLAGALLLTVPGGEATN